MSAPTSLDRINQLAVALDGGKSRTASAMRRQLLAQIRDDVQAMHDRIEELVGTVHRFSDGRIEHIRCAYFNDRAFVFELHDAEAGDLLDHAAELSRSVTALTRCTRLAAKHDASLDPTSDALAGVEFLAGIVQALHKEVTTRKQNTDAEDLA